MSTWLECKVFYDAELDAIDPKDLTMWYKLSKTTSINKDKITAIALVPVKTYKIGVKDSIETDSVTEIAMITFDDGSRMYAEKGVYDWLIKGV